MDVVVVAGEERGVSEQVAVGRRRVEVRMVDGAVDDVDVVAGAASCWLVVAVATPCFVVADGAAAWLVVA